MVILPIVQKGSDMAEAVIGASPRILEITTYEPAKRIRLKSTIASSFPQTFIVC